MRAQKAVCRLLAMNLGSWPLLVKMVHSHPGRILIEVWWFLTSGGYGYT
jgi:hypothetical protein